MTTRNLDALFEPKSIALIGASNQPRSVGAVTAKNLFEAGFAGPIVTVNPHEQAIRSTINYHSVEELPLAPDLAVIATPPPTVPEIVASLGARGTRAVIVLTAGFVEGRSRLRNLTSFAFLARTALDSFRQQKASTRALPTSRR